MRDTFDLEDVLFHVQDQSGGVDASQWSFSYLDDR